MNAFYLSHRNLEEMLHLKQYVITGILGTGEITLALVSQFEREVLDKLLDKSSETPNCEEEAISVLYKLSELHGNNSRELIKAWEQMSIQCSIDGKSRFDFDWKTVDICPKNGLQIKKFRDY